MRGILDQERRQRVARRASRCRGCHRSCRGCGSAASRRCGAAAASAGSAEATSPSAASVYVSAAPQHELVALVVPAAQLGHAPEVDQRVGPLAVGVERDHEIGAAGDRAGPGMRGAQAERLLERARCVHVHVYTLGDAEAGARSARGARPRTRRRARPCARAAACVRCARATDGRRTGCADGGTRARRPSARPSAPGRAGAGRRSRPARCGRPAGPGAGPGRPRRGTPDPCS